MAEALYKAGLLTEIDRAALAGYCQAWARWVKAEKEITKKGETVFGVNGTLKKSPWVSIAKDAQKQMHDFLVEFGMTPSSRSRVQAAEMQQMSLAELLFQSTKERSR